MKESKTIVAYLTRSGNTRVIAGTLQRALHAELRGTITDKAVAAGIAEVYKLAIPADSFARCVAFAIGQPEDVDINEILFRPTVQLY